MQVTVQEYREAFIDENLPLTTVSIHRLVLEVFAKSQSEFKLNLTTRNIFDYLLFNANAHRRSATFGEVSDVVYADIARYLGRSENTIQHEIVKLVKSGLIERHAVKRNCFRIPSMLQARQEMIAQAEMKKKMRVTEAAEKEIADGEEGAGRKLSAYERNLVYATVAHRMGVNGNGNGTYEKPELPF